VHELQAQDGFAGAGLAAYQDGVALGQAGDELVQAIHAYIDPFNVVSSFCHFLYLLNLNKLGFTFTAIGPNPSNPCAPGKNLKRMYMIIISAPVYPG
jgi:hypothetical protein